MIFEQFKVNGLGCYSYMIGCPGTGSACVVDPERHIDRYLDAARINSVTITHIFDTHLHADHISGALELAAATGAQICIHPSIEAGFDHSPVHEGDVFTFGTAKINILETPGHTPDSISLVISDLSRSSEPVFICTGDLLFVGDIGRPDLAGEGLLEEQVKNLYGSLYEKLGKFPDHLEIYPAHGQGSLCGKSISAKPLSTLGYERRWNPLFNGLDFETFRNIMISDFETRPPDFESIVRKNRSGPEPVSSLSALKELSIEEVEQYRERSNVKLVDIRYSVEFGSAYVPGSINVGFVDKSATWLGLISNPLETLILISNDYASALESRKRFQRIGFDRIPGCLTGGVRGYVDGGYDLEHIPQLTVGSLVNVLSKYGDHIILDVRTRAETKKQPFNGALNVSLEDIVKQGLDLPEHRHITVVCNTGYRANMAACILKARGYRHVFCLMGGVSAWLKAHDTSR